MQFLGQEIVKIKSQIKVGSRVTDNLNDRLTLQELHGNNQHQDLEIIKKTLVEMAGKISENSKLAWELAQAN